MPPAERCLWCGGPLLNGRTISELLFVDDELCGKCRGLLTPIAGQVKLGDLSVQGLYVYDEAFMKMLVQYKECMDEALRVERLFGNQAQTDGGLRYTAKRGALHSGSCTVPPLKPADSKRNHIIFRLIDHFR